MKRQRRWCQNRLHGSRWLLPDLFGLARFTSPAVGRARDEVGFNACTESLKLLSYGFQAYIMVRIHAANQAAFTPKVWKGSASMAEQVLSAIWPLRFPRALNRSSRANLSGKKLIAPIEGQVIRTLKLSLDGQPYGEYPVLALEAVPQAGIFGRMIDTIRLWFN